MTPIRYHQLVKIFCSGIGGIGLSAYASLRKAEGHDVSGSDKTMSALLEDLRSQGITVGTDQSGALIPTDCDLLVYSEAIPENAPERVRAKALGVRQQSYPQALGDLSRGKRVIAVCGTHGKSSTTGMAARLLVECGLDPTIVIGTKIRELDGRNWRVGKGDLFLLEACEYKRSFLNYDPSVILLTTCDGDHFDYYKDMDDYRSAFVKFVRKLSKDGTLVTHAADPDCARIGEESGRTVIDADAYPLIPLQTPGLHMRQNAQLVLALADQLKIPQVKAEKAVSGYAGSWRRLEVKGTRKDGVTVIDDYGHHPREVRASLAAVREAYPQRRIVCVFQPHTHDRTLKLHADFATSFADADIIIVTDIYEARRERDTAQADPILLAKEIAARSGRDAVYGGSLAETQLRLSDVVHPGDVLVCMGAGDITGLAAMLVA